MSPSLLRLIERLAKYIARISTPLASKSDAGVSLSAAEIRKWHDGMKEAIVQYQTAAGMLGASAENMTDQIKASLGQSIATQLAYLDGFAIEVQNDKTFNRNQAARALSYANGIKVPYWQGKVQFLPLPAMPAEGTICHGNCKCSWNIQTIDADAGDYDCYWVRASDDSCSTCIARERRWSPYQIRGGDPV